MARRVVAEDPAGPLAGAHRPPVVLLSWFGGIATAMWALCAEGVRPYLSVSWEDHAPSAELAKAHFPEVVGRGDFRRDGPEEIIALLRERKVPDGAVVLGTAGPPCPDYTQIKGDRALGRAGPEGRKFVEFAELLLKLQAACPWNVLFLVENVVPGKLEEARFFEDLLRVPARWVDAEDFGLIRRPRLWWSNVPVLPEAAVVSEQRGFVRLRPRCVPLKADQLDLG